MLKSAKQLGFCDEQIAHSIERYVIVSFIKVADFETTCPALLLV
jgi:hypothetical protein